MSLYSPILSSDSLGVKWAKLQRALRDAIDNAGISYSIGTPYYLSDIRVSDTEGVKWAKLGAWMDLLATNISGGSGGGDMLRANNLSDVLSVATSRNNLGLGIGDAVEFLNLTLSGGTLTLGTTPLVGSTNLLEQRNGANAQTYNLYNTTDGTNKELAFLSWGKVANSFIMGTEKAGTGTERTFEFYAGENGGQVVIYPTGAIDFNKRNTGTRWQIGTTGNLTSAAGNLTVGGGTLTGGASGVTLEAGGTNQPAKIVPSGTGPIVLFSSDDISLSRLAAGSLGLGTGAAGSAAGSLSLANLAVSTGIIAPYIFGNNVSGLFFQQDGIIRATNYAGNDFNRLQFGGSTSAFPSLKRSGTDLHVRLADDSAFSSMSLLNLTATGGNGTAVETVGTLPTTAAAGRFVGAGWLVTDALAPSLGAAVAAGGAAKVRVWWDGTDWIVG